MANSLNLVFIQCFFIISLAISIYGQTCDTTDSHVKSWANSCYRFFGEAKNYQDASDYCRNNVDGDYHLLDIESQEEQNAVATIIYNATHTLLGYERIFISPKETIEPAFRWVYDNSLMQSSECYRDTNRNTLTLINSQATTSTQCQTDCINENQGYIYSGTRFFNSAQLECFCGTSSQTNTLAQNTRTSCNLQCPGDSAQTCGGSDSGLYVVSLNSAGFSDWASGGEPNNQDGYQLCLSLKGDSFKNYKWADERCEKMAPYICQFDQQNCDGGYQKSGNVCFKMFNQELNWYQARYSCHKLNGYLPKIDSEELNTLFKDNAKVQDTNVGQARIWWIGATRSKWTLSDGSDALYTDFAQNKPDNSNYMCTVISRNAGGGNKFHWEDAPCGGTYPFICEYVAPTTTSTSTSTTTTTTTTTPKPTTIRPTTTPTTTAAPTTTTSTTTTTTTKPITTRPTTTTTAKDGVTKPTTTTTTGTTTTTTPYTGSTTTTITPPTTTTTKSDGGLTQAQSGEDDKWHTDGVIAAIVAAGVAVILGFVRLLFFCCQRSS